MSENIFPLDKLSALRSQVYIAGIDPIDGHVTHPPTVLKKVGDVVHVTGRQMGKRRMAHLAADMARDFFLDPPDDLTGSPRLRLFEPALVDELLSFCDVMEMREQRRTYPQWPANNYTADELAYLGHS